MKQSGIIAVVFVIGCATGGVAAQLVVPPVRAGTSPARWEYQCEFVDAQPDAVTGTLNRLGAEGWELVSMTARQTMTGGYGGVTSYMPCTKRAMP